MDYDYMDADTGGSNPKGPKKKEEEKKNDEDYVLNYEENNYIEQ